MSLRPIAAQELQAQGSPALRAAKAYANADRADMAGELAGNGGTGNASPNNFGAALQQALQGVVATGRAADAQAQSALLGTGSITEVVTAIAKAELALQTTMAVRDRVVQAYQDIMRMPI